MPTNPPATSPAASPRSAGPNPRTALVLLILINLMNYVDRQILSATEESIGKDFNITADKTGLLATAFLLAYMVLSPVFGILGDRWRRWAVVGIGVVVWSLASGGTGLVAVQFYWMLLMMRVLVGVGEAAYGPVAPTLLADLYPVEKRGKILAWFYAAIPVGSAIGYVIGGLFEAHWRWAFYVTVPPGIALAIWAFFMREPVRPQVHGTASSAGSEPSPHRSKRDAYLSLLHNRSYVLDTIGMIAMTFAIGGIAFFMPRYLKENSGIAPGRATLLFGGIIVVSGLLATLLGGIAGDKLRARFPGAYFLVSATGMFAGFVFTLLMLVTPFPACWLVIFAACFCLFFNTGPSNTILANVTPPAIRATAFAVNIFFIHAFGDAISPFLIGRLQRDYGLKVGFFLVSILMLAGGVAWLVGARYLEADTKRVEGESETSAVPIAH